MALCSACQAIEIPSLPPFTGFNQITSMGQPHRRFQDLRESALSCPLCSLIFSRFMEWATHQPRGAIAYGPDGNRSLHFMPQDKDTVLLVGLSRSGWNETEKLFYGFQALCGSLRSSYGLFADEGFNLPIFNHCPLHAPANSPQEQPLRSVTLLLGGFLGQLSNATDLWSGCAHVLTLIVSAPRMKKLSAM